MVWLVKFRQFTGRAVVDIAVIDPVSNNTDKNELFFSLQNHSSVSYHPGTFLPVAHILLQLQRTKKAQP